MSSELSEIEKKIADIEAQWVADLEREHGGGLDSKLNEKLIKLRLARDILKRK